MLGQVDHGTQNKEGNLLYDLKLIKEKLDSKFEPLEPRLSGFRLVSPKDETQYLGRLEKQTAKSLPKDFQRICTTFDLGNFTIGPIVFGNSENYTLKLCELNGPSQEFPWWGAGKKRPESLLLIAYSDPYSILLNLDIGEVLTFDNTKGYEDAFCIASKFSLFFRAVGTIFFERNEREDKDILCQQILNASGKFEGKEFWDFLIE